MTLIKEEKISIDLSMPVKTLRLLEGAFDMHTHPGPDFVPRIFDIYELAEQCRKLGMAGFVAKNHNLLYVLYYHNILLRKRRPGCLQPDTGCKRPY